MPNEHFRQPATDESGGSDDCRTFRFRHTGNHGERGGVVKWKVSIDGISGRVRPAMILFLPNGEAFGA